MSIQYAKNTKLTLPCVEGWGSDLGIIKDPPKGVFTKQKWKVSDTQDINNMIDDSGDRIAEGINIYARGVNPMASMSYDNVTNNAGTKSVFGNSKQATKVNKIGIVRPPMLTNMDLLPLSRLPRARTCAAGIAQKTDWTKSRFQQENFRQVKDSVLVTNVRPTATSSIQSVMYQHSDVSGGGSIKDDVLTFQATSGIVGKTNTLQSNNVSTKNILENVLNPNAQTNVGDNLHYVNNNTEMATDYYIHDPNYTTAMTNVKGYSQNNKETYNESNYSLDKILPSHANRTNISDNNKFVRITPENELDLQKVLPSYTSSTNIYDNRHQKTIRHENDMELSKVLPSHTMRTNMFESKYKIILPEQEMVLEKVLPSYTSSTNVFENKYKIIQHEKELELFKVLPSYTSQTNISDNNNFIRINHDNDILLQKVLPCHTSRTNMYENKFKMIGPDNEMELQRNLPSHTSSTNVYENKFKMIGADNEMELQRNLPSYTSGTNMYENKFKMIGPDNEMELQRNLPSHTSSTNVYENKFKMIGADNEMELEKNVPAYSTRTNMYENKFKMIGADNEMELEKNIPSHSTRTNVYENKYKNIAADKDLELSKVIPTHSTRTNIYDSSIYKNVKHDKELELERNTPLQTVFSNVSQYDNPNNMNSGTRTAKLNPTLTLGGVEGLQSIPAITRQEEMTIEPNKNKLKKIIEEQRRERNE